MVDPGVRGDDDREVGIGERLVERDAVQAEFVERGHVWVVVGDEAPLAQKRLDDLQGG